MHAAPVDEPRSAVNGPRPTRRPTRRIDNRPPPALPLSRGGRSVDGIHDLGGTSGCGGNTPAVHDAVVTRAPTSGAAGP
jgi:hypothetical protein